MSLLNEIGSWVNFRAILNQFPQKINVCFVYLHEHNKKHNEILLGFCKLVRYMNWVSLFPFLCESGRRRQSPSTLLLRILSVTTVGWHTGAQEPVWQGHSLAGLQVLCWALYPRQYNKWAGLNCRDLPAQTVVLQTGGNISYNDLPWASILRLKSWATSAPDAGLHRWALQAFRQ